MYGQLRDIEAWIGDAAYNRIDGVTTDVARGEDPTVDISYVDGESEVPNPANSDLWLATQEVDGEVTQRWTQHDDGQWALLIAADGTEPAPTDVSVSFQCRTRFAVDHPTDDYRHCTDSSWYRSSTMAFHGFPAPCQTYLGSSCCCAW